MAKIEKPFHEVVAEKLIVQLKAGTAPWQRPWEPGDTLPTNPNTGNRYKGINSIHLISESRDDNRWLTYKQASAMGFQVRKGEKGTSVQYWKFSEEQTKLDDNGKPILGEDGKPFKEEVKLERPRTFMATVFNAEQIEGMPPLEKKNIPWNAHERAEDILQFSGAKFSLNESNRAFYRPSTDSIHLPEKNQFDSGDKYYATALHELGHWTGHSSRLNRDITHPFGSEAYAKEELRAEISSMIIGDELGVGHDTEQHTAYVGSWIKVLQDDPLEIFRAAADAEKIQGYIFSLENQQNIENTVADNIREKELGSEAMIAREHEEIVSRDPNSTDEDILEAKKLRKDVEVKEMLNDVDLQKTIKEDKSSHSDSRAQHTYINVPYMEKDAVKSLGAKWDRKEQSWYVPASVDMASFSRWEVKSEPKTQQSLSDSKNISKSQSKTFLAVPFGERELAKSSGALWDRTAKSWYVGPNSDVDKLNRWLPDNVPNQQSPAVTPAEEFADALRSMACVVSGGHPIMDGKKHRIPADGDKKGEIAGFYIGHLDGHPAGYIKNNRTGLEMKWKSKGYSLSEEEKAKLNADAATKLEARAKELDRTHDATAKRVNALMGDLIAVSISTPYLKNKGIKAHLGALTDKEGKTTFLPAQDVGGKIWTIQYINEDGTKRFAKDSKKEGCFHVVGGMEALAEAPVLVVGEGYSTAATGAEALGFATVAAFDSGNLPGVVSVLHKKFPEKPVVVIGDDDRYLEMTQGMNPGRVKAEAAAKAVGGKAVFPVFTPKETEYPSSLPAISLKAWRKKQLTENQKATLDRIRKYTDFNDLAEKSELGLDGVKRQLSTAVSLSMKKGVSISEFQNLAKKQEKILNKKRVVRNG